MYPFQKETGMIKSDNERGPIFGFQDIIISNNFLKKESKCNFPDEYGGINDLENEFNGGNSEFIVKELEIYSVIKQGLK